MASMSSLGSSKLKMSRLLAMRINVPACAMDQYKRLLPKHLHKKLVEF